MGFRTLLVSTKVPECSLGVVFPSYLDNDAKSVDLFRHNSSLAGQMVFNRMK